MHFFFILLMFMPISWIASAMGASGTVVFVMSALSIIGLVAVLGKATEDAAYYLGERVGGFLIATFGNVAELLINIYALKAGLIDMVKSFIIGSIIESILLVLGVSLLCGGLKHKVQRFDLRSVELHSSMLLFAVIGMSIPAFFIHTMQNYGARVEELSLVIAGIMFILYILQMIFTFFTHKGIFENEYRELTNGPGWTLKTSVIVMLVVTVALCIQSEIFTGSVQSMTESFGFSEIFVGLILVPVIGNIAENITAVIMAMKNKMNVAIEVSVGSALQVILFVMPILVFMSFIWKPMNLLFAPAELVVLICSTLITNKIIEDGRSNWLEGAQLLGVYIIIAIAFFII